MTSARLLTTATFLVALLLLEQSGLAFAADEVWTGAGRKASEGASLMGDHTGPAPEVDVSVPQSKLAPAQGAEVISVDKPSVLAQPRYGEGARLEADAFYWAPGALTAQSHLSDASAFGATIVPGVSINLFSSPVAHWRGLRLSLVGGVSFETLSRSGTFPGDDATPAEAITEQGYFVPLRLGAEAELPVLRHWSVFSSFAVLPTGFFTVRSVFVTDQGVSLFGLPLELRAGVANELSWLSPTLEGVELRLGFVGTANTFGDTNFSGAGATAGFSISL